MTRTVWTLAWLLLFISANSGRRYLRISIDRRYAGCQRLGILGHELRHAVEIADAASVTENATQDIRSSARSSRPQRDPRARSAKALAERLRLA